MNVRRTMLAVVLLQAPGTTSAVAQSPANMELYQDQAVDCLAAVPDTARAFTLHSPSVMTFLESALIDRWTQGGIAVFRHDSLLARPLPSLAYQVEHARVSYEAARRRQLSRTVSLALQFSWTTRAGQIQRSERCVKSNLDYILRHEIPLLETPAYPETTAPLPTGNWTRRYLEPVAIGAATAFTVFLFFNLRTSRAAPGG